MQTPCSTFLILHFSYLRPEKQSSEFSTTPPLVYHYGHVTPGDNVKLFKLQQNNLANDINQKLQKHDKRTRVLPAALCSYQLPCLSDELL